MVSAAALVVGHHPWDGPVLVTFEPGRGLHVGDVAGVVVLVGAVLMALRARGARGPRG